MLKVECHGESRKIDRVEGNARTSQSYCRLQINMNTLEMGYQFIGSSPFMICVPNSRNHRGDVFVRRQASVALYDLVLAYSPPGSQGRYLSVLDQFLCRAQLQKSLVNISRQNLTYHFLPELRESLANSNLLAPGRWIPDHNLVDLICRASS